MTNKFQLIITKEADEYLTLLKENKSKKAAYKAVANALIKMSENLRHPSLHTHEFHSMKGPNDEKIFESYAQNQTPGVHRIFWYYGPKKNEITIFSITHHP